MEHTEMNDFLKQVLENMPEGWLRLTTHRLDIYDEKLAKTQFLEDFQRLFEIRDASTESLTALPTAYDYIRLGHPLSCILEWAVARMNDLKPDSVISFTSELMPLMAILRKNLWQHKPTRILYDQELPVYFDTTLLHNVYGYSFELQRVGSTSAVDPFEGTTLFYANQAGFSETKRVPEIDFYVHSYTDFGSLIIASGEQNENYISEIQHVRRRETIAMTPINCLRALKQLTGLSIQATQPKMAESVTASVVESIAHITGAPSKPLVGSSGLSVQYAIMMGLIDEALENHPGKAIKFVVPPNCYGGTNDQARRVAAAIAHVEVVDLAVDGEDDMVRSIDMVLGAIAREDAIPYIIAEIPTNPRVEVPNLEKLKSVLEVPRNTASGEKAIDPVFILDQTFCPNVRFLGDGEILSTVRAISYVSGSKFPSGGKCTAGYCVANAKASYLTEKIETHLKLCGNEATADQIKVLAEQLPSMNRRIELAYENTSKFVHFIQSALPEAKINFVSEELANRGFTPSVFSLDLPAKGDTHEEREAHKRALNHKLIDSMISKIPNESKYCVSYGQLSGCYWTIPATSTQGTTKEGDKDYIARVALSPNMDVERHIEVFADFVSDIQS